MRLGICFCLALAGATSSISEPIVPVEPRDRDTQPTSPPRPIYPEEAVTLGISGKCNVKLDVTAAGKPVNVDAECTDPIFVQSAADAMRCDARSDVSAKDNQR